MPQKDGWTWLIYPAAALGLLVLVGATVMASLTNAYNTPAGSMRPSLEIGDHLFAWTDYYSEHAPERGEIVLFLRGDDTVFIKRVIGLPGDTIQMKGGRLWINGAEVVREEQDSIQDATYSTGQVLHLDGGRLLAG